MKFLPLALKAFITFTLSTSLLATGQPATEQDVQQRLQQMYQSLGLQDNITEEAFIKGVTGFTNLGGTSTLAILDYSTSMSKKRFVVIDFQGAQPSVSIRSYGGGGKGSGGGVGNEGTFNMGAWTNPGSSFLGFMKPESTSCTSASQTAYVNKARYYVFLVGLSDTNQVMAQGVEYKGATGRPALHNAEYCRPGKCNSSYGCITVPNNVSREVCDHIAGRSAIIYSHKAGYTDNVLQGGRFQSQEFRDSFIAGTYNYGNSTFSGTTTDPNFRSYDENRNLHGATGGMGPSNGMMGLMMLGAAGSAYVAYDQSNQKADQMEKETEHLFHEPSDYQGQTLEQFREERQNVIDESGKYRTFIEGLDSE